MKFEDASSERKKKVPALSVPTPGQMLQGMYEDSSGLNLSLNGQSVGASRPFPPTPAALQEQQDASDTIRTGNRSHSPPKNEERLSDLFKPPPAAAPRKETIDMQPTGPIDFRAALLAEQQQQEEILREQQRRFEEQQRKQHMHDIARPATPNSPSPPSSPAHASSPPPVPTLKAENFHNNTPKPPSRPNLVTNANRGSSDGTKSSSPSTRPNPVTNATRGSSLKSKNGEGHTRQVSFSLQKLETEFEDSFRTPPRSVNAGGRPPLSPGSSHRSTSTANRSQSHRVQLSDVFGFAPVETEAESNIMRAVDELGLLERNNKAKTPSEPPPFFSNLPHDFMLPLDEEEEQKQEQPQRTKGHKLAISELSLHSQDREPPRPQIPPYQSGRKRRAKAHRPSMSVEQTLFGLTAQLGKLDDDALKHLLDEEDVEDLDEFEKGDKVKEEDDKEHRTKSSAENLAARANKLVSNAMHKSHRSGRSLIPPHPLIAVTDIESPVASVHDKIPEESSNDEKDDTSAADHENENETNGQSVSPHASLRNKRDSTEGGLREEWNAFRDFLSPCKETAFSYCKTVLLFFILPSTAVATILFYFLDNPIVQDPNSSNNKDNASYSWFILFFGVRQVITFSMAKATQAIVIDFALLGSRYALRWMGPVPALLLVQSKGWPFITIFWACYNLGLLSGSNIFVRHWGYWQNWIAMFTEDNPSGYATASDLNYKIQRLAIAIGVLVAFKRLIVGVFQSRQTFLRYGEELAKVMASMVIIGEIATLSRLPVPRENSSYEKSDVNWRDTNLRTSDGEGSECTKATKASNVLDFPNLNAVTASTTGGKETTHEGGESAAGRYRAHTQESELASASVSAAVRTARSHYTESEQLLIIDMLERWEDPDRVTQELNKKATIGAILQFRRALTSLKVHYPFGAAFGPMRTRERCVDSAQNVYDRLLARDADQDEEDILNFDVLAVLAMDQGEFDEEKLREIIKLFRPDRDGKLSRLAFVKSVDATYKSMRLLSANIQNSSQIDLAVERLVNGFFYFFLGCVVLAVFNLDPLEIFLSLSSIVLAFSFLFAGASGKYFEGVLLILVQKPFGIGDRIHVANSEGASDVDGSSGWIVEHVNLFSTTICYGTTNERATISNGTLASSRIINAARSPNAIVYINLKFPIDAPYDKIQVFQSAVEAHVKARPREWLGFLGFRAFGISVDRGFIEYKVVVQHRDAWQNITSILNSKARLTTYCLEVVKQLEMRYSNPPLPVDLNVYNTNSESFPPEFLNNPAESARKTA